MNFRQLLRYSRGMKHYFIATALVFVVGVILGYGYSDQFTVYLESQLKGLEGIAGFINGKDHPQLWMFLLIFLNNAYYTLIVIYLGIMFGVLPLFLLLTNGMALGYIFATRIPDQAVAFFFRGILPHGIIEIPIIIIASAFGLKFGLLVAKGLLTFLSPARRSMNRVEIKKFIRLTIPLIVILAAGLLVAALIESTVTVWLMNAMNEI